MKWYKKAGFLLVAGASLLGLVACGQNNQSTDGKVTIEFFNQKTEMADTLQKIVDDFEKEHPNIDVKLTTVPSAGIVLKTRFYQEMFQILLISILKIWIFRSGRRQAILQI